ncbi:MAG: putative chaperone protein [Candidatus Azotimanducaceae bacterium]
MIRNESAFGVGLDFGTSNSAAAWFDGQDVHMIALEDDAVVMPTAVHLDRALLARTGTAAIQQYILENQDRIVELTPEVIAHASLVTGEAEAGDPFSQPEITTSAVYGAAVIDRGLPGRLFRGVKRLIGNAEMKRLMVFDHPFRLVALLTPMLKAIRQSIDRVVSLASDQVVIGRPVHFEGPSGASEVALARLAEASGYAGLQSKRFYPEPLAATLSYLVQNVRSGVEQQKGLALTFDFGGGTLDLSLVRFDGLQMAVLVTSGMAIGGDHIDQLMFKRFISPHLGKGERWVRRVDGEVIETEFPFDEFEALLLNWPVTYTLNQGKYRSKIRDGVQQGGAAAEKFQRLEALISHNLSYLVFQAIRAAKAQLSVASEAVIDIPELDLSIPVSLPEFDDLLRELLVQIEQLIDQTLARSGLNQSEVDLVIRTGGSSLIASIRQCLDARFPGKVVEHDPFTSVAAGLSIASYYGHEYDSATTISR